VVAGRHSMLMGEKSLNLDLVGEPEWGVRVSGDGEANGEGGTGSGEGASVKLVVY
jgi:hypothetical protein